MTPERLIELGRVYGVGIENQNVVFGVSKYSFETKSKDRKSFKVNIGAQGDRMRLIYGFNYAKSIAEAKFKEMHEISFRYILRSKNNWKK